MTTTCLSGFEMEESTRTMSENLLTATASRTIETLWPEAGLVASMRTIYNEEYCTNA